MRDVVRNPQTLAALRECKADGVVRKSRVVVRGVVPARTVKVATIGCTSNKMNDIFKLSFDKMTDGEKKIVRLLRRLNKLWGEVDPRFWLFCNGKEIALISTDKNHEYVFDSFGCVDKSMIIETYAEIDQDGGDY